MTNGNNNGDDNGNNNGDNQPQDVEKDIDEEDIAGKPVEDIAADSPEEPATSREENRENPNSEGSDTSEVGTEPEETREGVRGEDEEGRGI